MLQFLQSSLKIKYINNVIKPLNLYKAHGFNDISVRTLLGHCETTCSSA